MSGIASAIRTIVLWWPANQPALYRSIELAADQRCDLRNLFEKDVDTCWIQFIDASNGSTRQLRRHIPEDPYLGDDPYPNRPVPRDMSDADTVIAPSPTASMSTAPDYGPQPIPIHTRSSHPVDTSRSRSNYNPSTTPSQAPPIAPSRSPEKRPVDTQHHQGPPHKTPHIAKTDTSHGTSLSSSSWQAPSQIPQLPIHDNDNDTDSLASTMPYQEDAMFAVWKHYEDHCFHFPKNSLNHVMHMS